MEKNEIYSTVLDYFRERERARLEHEHKLTDIYKKYEKKLLNENNMLMSEALAMTANYYGTACPIRPARNQ